MFLPRPVFSIGILLFLVVAAQAEQLTPITAHFQGRYVAVSREDANLRVLEFMNKEDFVSIELTPDGAVYGRTEKVAVLFAATPFRDGINCFIVTAGRDAAEAERLIHALRDWNLEIPALAEAAKLVRAEGEKRRSTAPQLRWGADSRNVASTLRFFQPAGMIVMEKHGLAGNDGGMPNRPIAFGGSPQRMAVTLLLQGPNEINTHLYSIGICYDADEADRLQRLIRRDLIKVLFE